MDTFLNEQYNNSRDFLAQWSLYKDFRDMELPDPPEIAEAKTPLEKSVCLREWSIRSMLSFWNSADGIIL